MQQVNNELLDFIEEKIKIATNFETLQMYEKAFNVYNECLNLVQQNYLPTEEMVAVLRVVYSAKGDILFECGRYSEALNEYFEVERLMSNFNYTPKWIISTYRDIAFTFYYLGNLNDAKRYITYSNKVENQIYDENFKSVYDDLKGLEAEVEQQIERRNDIIRKERKSTKRKNILIGTTLFLTSLFFLILVSATVALNYDFSGVIEKNISTTIKNIYDVVNCGTGDDLTILVWTILLWGGTSLFGFIHAWRKLYDFKLRFLLYFYYGCAIIISVLVLLIVIIFLIFIMVFIALALLAVYSYARK